MEHGLRLIPGPMSEKLTSLIVEWKCIIELGTKESLLLFTASCSWVWLALWLLHAQRSSIPCVLQDMSTLRWYSSCLLMYNIDNFLSRLVYVGLIQAHPDYFNSVVICIFIKHLNYTRGNIAWFTYQGAAKNCNLVSTGLFIVCSCYDIHRQWHSNLKLRNSYFTTKMSRFSRIKNLALAHTGQSTKQSMGNFFVLLKFCIEQLSPVVRGIG